MKYLIIQKITRVPIGTWAKLLPLHYKYLDNLENEGKIEISYHLIGRQGNLLIVNANSDEELTSIIGDDPLFFYSKRKIYPLTTREKHLKHLKRIFDRH